jgi:hypothetical protein
MQKAKRSEAFETWLRSNHLSLRFTRASRGPAKSQGERPEQGTRPECETDVPICLFGVGICPNDRESGMIGMRIIDLSIINNSGPKQGW